MYSDQFLDELRSRVAVSSVVGRAVKLTRKGPESVGLCPFHNESTPSFTVNDDKGFFHCFGCNAHGDVIDFVMKAENMDFKAAVERLSDGKVEITNLPARVNGKANGHDKADPDVIYPVPESAPKPPEEFYRLGKPSRVWQYRSPTKRLLGLIYRFETPNGGKEIIPQVWTTLGWRWQSFPKPRWLYGLDRLADRPGEPVLLTEGEKACDASGALIPAMVNVTWPGGSNAVKHVDWEPLRGRDIVLWPDADKAGIEAMEEVGNILFQMGCGMKFLRTFK